METRGATGTVTVTLPGWVAGLATPGAVYPTDEARMRLAVAIARENVIRGTGGPFGAAVFERGTGRLVAAGVNLVEAQRNCTLHGEMVAFMMAQAAVGSWTLRLPGGPEHELFTSCEPCAMCLGASLWSGVTRVVCAAAREDALDLGFDEGPVFPESHDYLRARGVELVFGVLRAEGRAALELYRATGGTIYGAAPPEAAP